MCSRWLWTLTAHTAINTASSVPVQTCLFDMMAGAVITAVLRFQLLIAFNGRKGAIPIIISRRINLNITTIDISIVGISDWRRCIGGCLRSIRGIDIVRRVVIMDVVRCSRPL